MEFSVRVAATYCRGELVFDGSKIVNAPGSGQFLRPACVGLPLPVRA
jgi:allantoinase